MVHLVQAHQEVFSVHPNGAGHAHEQKHVGNQVGNAALAAGAKAVHHNGAVEPNLQHKHKGKAEGVVGVPIHHAASRLGQNGQNAAYAEDEHQVKEELNVRSLLRVNKIPHLAVMLQNSHGRIVAQALRVAS